MTRSIPKKYFFIYGAGIIGAAVAYKLRKRYPNCDITVCDPLGTVGGIQTLQCSNVLHTGVLSPGQTNKRKYCKQAMIKLPRLCGQLGVNKKKIIKIVHANNKNMAKLVDCTLAANIKILPRCPESNLEGLCYEAWIIDYEQLTKKLMPKDVKFMKQSPLYGFFDGVFVCAGNETLNVLRQDLNETTEGHLVYVDSMYVLTDLDTHESHYEMTDQKTLFLGKHTTPMINGGTKIGPNALFSLKNFILTKSFLPRMKFFMKNFFYFYNEWRNNNLNSFINWSKQYVSESYNVLGTKNGTRSVLINNKGDLLSKDFVYHKSKKPIFACLNTGSPAASTCIQIAEELVNQFNNYVG